MSSTSETTDVEKEPSSQAKPNQLSVDEEIRLLKEAHGFLEDFPIPGKMGFKWAQLLDTIGLVTNSLVAKDKEAKAKK